MADLKGLGREIFYSGNKAVIAMRFEDEPDEEERTYAICKDPFKRFSTGSGQGIQAKKCITTKCFFDIKEKKRKLESVKCRRKVKFKDVKFFSGSLVDAVDLDESPFEMSSKAILKFRKYEKTKLRKFDEGIFDDLETRGQTVFEQP